MSKEVKVFLDDKRLAPTGWTRTKTVAETIEYLKTGKVEELSLDHDLGMYEEDGNEVLLWLEEQVIVYGFIPPKLFIHTANPAARREMELAVRSINIWAERNRVQGVVRPSDAS